jgi:hypothetical protein
MKHVLCVRVCSSSTTYTSEHRIILMISTNMGVTSALASAFGLELLGTLWACLLPDVLTAQQYHDFLEAILLGLLEVVPLAVLAEAVVSAWEDAQL